VELRLRVTNDLLVLIDLMNYSKYFREGSSMERLFKFYVEVRNSLRYTAFFYSFF
jgi:hypothetical protein